jgi:hypothetical protein
LNAPLLIIITLLGIEIEARAEQYENALPPMVVTLSGMVIEVSKEQPENALPPMVVTLSGMVMEVSEEQPENALTPMVVTLSGMVMEAREEQPENALSPMVVTPSGIRVVDLHPAISLLVAVSIIALQLFRLSYTLLELSTSIEAREEQASKTPTPIWVTEFGIVIEVSA